MESRQRPFLRWVPNYMLRAKDTTDELFDVLVNDVVVRRLPRVPQIEARFNEQRNQGV